MMDCPKCSRSGAAYVLVDGRRVCGGCGHQYPRDPEDLYVGDIVRKVTGDYRLDGVVVGISMTLAGKVCYTVEHHPAAPGLLHIYSRKNLELIRPA